jgi:hypothetical protein
MGAVRLALVTPIAVNLRDIVPRAVIKRVFAAFDRVAIRKRQANIADVLLEFLGNLLEKGLGFIVQFGISLL